MRATTGYCIIEVSEFVNNKIVAPGGTEFYVDPSWDYHHHVQLKHKVVSVSPQGDSYFNVGWKSVPKVAADFEEGDEVYVMWSYVDQDKAFMVDGKTYLKVPVSTVFAKVTEDGFEACGEWAILEPLITETGIESDLLILPDELKKATADDMGHVVTKGSTVSGEIKIGDLMLVKRNAAQANPGHEHGDPDTLNALRIGNRKEGTSLAFTNYIEGRPYYVQFAASHEYRPIRVQGKSFPSSDMNELICTLSQK